MVDFFPLAAISYATRALFLGDISKVFMVPVDKRNTPGQPSFLDINGTDFIWGDVLKGIEEISHNVTAALLTLSLGTMNATCSLDQVVGYRYTSFALWVPYCVSNFSCFSSYYLTFSLLCFIDGLGHCSNFTHCCHHDNGEK